MIGEMVARRTGLFLPDEVWEVPVSVVADYVDPLSSWPWVAPRPADPVTLDLVDSVPTVMRPLTNEQIVGPDTGLHLGRIRYFLEWPSNDPISIDVGCFGYVPAWPLVDGNHRMVAAMLREDRTILVTISGSLDDAADIFGLPDGERNWRV